MTSPPNSQTSPTPKNNRPLRGSPISKHPYGTCHIGCQPLSTPPRHLPPPHKEDPSPPSQLPAPPLQGRVMKGPKHHPDLPQPRLTTLNTSYHSTIRGLARRSVTPRSTPSSIPTHTKPGNSGRGGTTSTPSPQATSTLTFTPPPPMRKLPLAQARAARAKAKLGSLLPLNLLRVRRPLLLKRGRLLEFVTGRTGPRKTRAPGPFPRPAPLNGLGRGVFFGIPCPCPRSGPRPTHTRDGSPLKMGGNKRGPSRE